MAVYSVDKLISEARKLASNYRKATGKPLAGVSVEIARNDAARLLDLDLCEPQTAGYDAVGRGKWEGKRIQIKGRAIFDESKTGQRVGQLKMDQEWDRVVLVLMDAEYEPFEIYAAARDEIAEATTAAGQRSGRGALSVAKFKNIGQLVWERERGVVDDEIWDNMAGK